MTHYGYHDKKAQLINRLSRAEGQVRGIARMINDDKYCIDILTQLSAVESALDQVALELLREHSRHCLADTTLSAEARAAKADELVNAVGRLLAK